MVGKVAFGESSETKTNIRRGLSSFKVNRDNKFPPALFKLIICRTKSSQRIKKYGRKIISEYFLRRQTKEESRKLKEKTIPAYNHQYTPSSMVV